MRVTAGLKRNSGRRRRAIALDPLHTERSRAFKREEIFGQLLFVRDLTLHFCFRRTASETFSSRHPPPSNPRGGTLEGHDQSVCLFCGPTPLRSVTKQRDLALDARSFSATVWLYSRAVVDLERHDSRKRAAVRLRIPIGNSLFWMEVLAWGSLAYCWRWRC